MNGVAGASSVASRGAAADAAAVAIAKWRVHCAGAGVLGPVGVVLRTDGLEVHGLHRSSGPRHTSGSLELEDAFQDRPNPLPRPVAAQGPVDALREEPTPDVVGQSRHQFPPKK